MKMKQIEVIGSDASLDALAVRIRVASEALQQDALVAINRSVTARAWLTGYYIVEYEQQGANRAKYGERLLSEIADRLKDRGDTVSSLKSNRLFYKVFPELAGPVGHYLEGRFGKGQSPIVQSREKKIGQSAIVQLEHGFLVEEGEKIKLSPWALFSRLSYTHMLQLLPMQSEQMRIFYAFEAMRGTWSVRELKRQIESQYYQRCLWAKDPHKYSAIAQGKADKLDPKDFIKQDHILEFLGLEPTGEWDEDDLEQGIYDRLRDFILEIGEGFCFEARQKKILIDDVYEKIDLVFYHRILKCHVLIELKPKKLNYKDVAQISLYMSYYRKNKMTTGDNPPIGILLCTGVGKETAEYLAPFTDPQLFLSTYQLQLPTVEKFTDFLKKENEGLPASADAKNAKAAKERKGGRACRPATADGRARTPAAPKKGGAK